MQNIMFFDKNHLDFYVNTADRMKETRKINNLDVYQKALIYTLGLLADCRTHFDQIFSIADNEINPEVLSAGWQTSGSIAITTFAFNLWNEFVPDNAPESASVAALFSRTSHLTPYLLEAIKLRFPLKDAPSYDVLEENGSIILSKVSHDMATAYEALAPGRSVVSSPNLSLNI